jgi:hypothetical protein
MRAVDDPVLSLNAFVLLRYVSEARMTDAMEKADDREEEAPSSL